MSNTTTISENVITITGLDADWSYSGDTPFTSGIKLQSIRFTPSAAADVMIVNNAAIDGAELFRVTVTGADDDRVQYYGGIWAKPFIDIGDCTFGTAANAKVTLVIE